MVRYPPLEAERDPTSGGARSKGTETGRTYSFKEDHKTDQKTTIVTRPAISLTSEPLMSKRWQTFMSVVFNHRFESSKDPESGLKISLLPESSGAWIFTRNVSRATSISG